MTNCKVHWQLDGWIKNTQSYGESCALRYVDFPDRTDPNYAREPGSDDEG